MGTIDRTPFATEVIPEHTFVPVTVQIVVFSKENNGIAVIAEVSQVKGNILDTVDLVAGNL